VEVLTPPAGGPSPGLLVPCRAPSELGAAVARLLGDPPSLATGREAAAALGRTLTWPRAAARFAEVLAAAATQGAPPPTGTMARVALRLDHLDRLTDTCGIVQFSKGTRPEPRSGYCVDDVARLAIVAAELARTRPDTDRRPQRWLATALRVLDRALCPDGMHNLLGPDRTWQDRPSVGEHAGRAIWALGVVSSMPGDTGARATGFLETMLPWLTDASSPRTLAYAILGLARMPATDARCSMISTLADRLETASGRDPTGPWYEPCLTHDNARLPQAVLAAGVACSEPDRIGRALSSLDWYVRQVGLSPRGMGYLRCVGNQWRDAAADGPTAGEGDESTPPRRLRHSSPPGWPPPITRKRRCPSTRSRGSTARTGPASASTTRQPGGCRDGPSAVGVRDNEGAESTLAYHQALLTMHAAGMVSLDNLPARYGLPAPRASVAVARRTSMVQKPP
jgi:hypothetical protein